jgi:ribosomal protein S18 acetylase RimI-like enzyme
MQAAICRIFERHCADTVVIDPQVSNRRAIAFYERLGFERVGVRIFDGDSCLVMRVRRSMTARTART